MFIKNEQGRESLWTYGIVVVAILLVLILNVFIVRHDLGEDRKKSQGYISFVQKVGKAKNNLAVLAGWQTILFQSQNKRIEYLGRRKIGEVLKELAGFQRELLQHDGIVILATQVAPILDNFRILRENVELYADRQVRLQLDEGQELEFRSLYQILDQQLRKLENDLVERAIRLNEGRFSRIIIYLSIEIVIFLILVFLLFMNMSKRRLAEKELRTTKKYLDNVVNSMPSMLWGIDPEGRITSINRMVEEVFGKDIHELSGKFIVEVFPFFGKYIKQIQRSIHDKEIWDNPRVVVQYDDHDVEASITAYPLVINGIQGSVIRLDDMTEKNRLEEMVVQSEKMLTVGGLAAGMAHEINNPLAGIVQNIQLLKNRLSEHLETNIVTAREIGIPFAKLSEYLDKREIHRIVDDIYSSGVRVSEIVANMLSFARKSDHSFSGHYLQDLIEDSIQLLRTDYDLKKNFDFKNIEFEREYDSDLPIVPCEGAKIQQVFLNILKNGAEEMGTKGTSDGEKPRFDIKVKNLEKYVQVEIKDNGKGMTDDVQHRIFEPFFTTKPIGEGTGLGLSVSYFIITKNHGGEMTVRSKPNEGARFIIRLKTKSDTDRL